MPPANAQPAHHLVLTTVITMICAFFNVSSLILGIPALLISIMVSASVIPLRVFVAQINLFFINSMDSFLCNNVHCHYSLLSFFFF